MSWQIMPQGKSRTRNEDLLGLFLSLVVSSARAVTIDPSTGVRGFLAGASGYGLTM